MRKIIRTNAENKDFQDLVRLLDEELSRRDGADHPFYAQFNKLDSIREVVLICQNDLAVGCGAFKRFDENSAEIKRMFVREEFRRRGIAAELLWELEKWAVERGYGSALLETGQNQPEAIRLYQKSGYEVIPNYGQYEGVEGSICMRKPLDFRF